MSIPLHVAVNRPLPRREKISTGRLGVLMIVLMSGFCLLAGSMILSMRQQIWADTARTSQNLLEAEVAGIDRLLTIYDASLRSAVQSVQSPLLRDRLRRSGTWRSSTISRTRPSSAPSASSTAMAASPTTATARRPRPPLPPSVAPWPCTGTHPTVPPG